MSTTSPTRTAAESGTAIGGWCTVSGGSWMTVTVPSVSASPLLSR